MRAFGLQHAELTFKEAYASRSGLWRFRKGVIGACVYVGQGVTSFGLRMHVRELGGGGGGEAMQPVLSGIVTPATRLTFRSRSSHLVLLVQVRGVVLL